MDITKCLTISTAHISSDTARKLSIEPDTNASWCISLSMNISKLNEK